MPRQRGGTSHIGTVQPRRASGALAGLAAHGQADAVFAAAGLNFALQHRELASPAYQLGVLAAAKALAAGQQPDRLQQIGFALPVGTAQNR